MLQPDSVVSVVLLRFLTAGLPREKRPDYIVPFQITKEDCKKAYGKMMRHAIFAPKELKDPRNVDNFRGIYMLTGYITLPTKVRYSCRLKKATGKVTIL